MKDIKNLLIYGGGSFAVIVFVIALASSGAVPADVVGYMAILLVIVLPVVIAVMMAKKERQQGMQDSE